MIKKEVVLKWNKESQEDLCHIKEANVEAPTLISLYFDKGFILYTFASDTSYAAVLTWKNDEGDGIHISLMSSNLEGAELKYINVKKKGLIVFKAVKHFRPYFPKDQLNVIVRHPTMRSLFVQK